MAGVSEQSVGAAMEDQPSEEELRAAYEAELNRITSSEMVLQTVVSLINIGGRRLGLGRPPTHPPTHPADSSAGSPAAGAERDLEQVRDAIDGASALLPILERRMPRELGPLRDAIAQLQVAYAREAHSAGGAGSTASPRPSTEQTEPAAKKDGQEQDGQEKGEQSPGPGPAEASGRLWVPGR
jgi:hypothetical protein